MSEDFFSDFAIFEGREFRFNNKEHCQQFETLLKGYNTIQNVKVSPVPDISKFNIYDAYSKFVDDAKYAKDNLGRKIFTLVFDIKLSYFYLQIEENIIYGTLNQINRHIKDLSQPITGLDSPEYFPACMELQRYYPVFTLRYRALWDKLMALLLLYFTGEKLEGKSKIRAFVKRSKSIDEIPDDFLEGLQALITAFNDRFRTHEAHGAGVFRKWSFLVLPRSQSSPTDLLTLFSGSMSYAIALISNVVLNDIKMPNSPHDGNGYFYVLRNELKNH